MKEKTFYHLLMEFNENPTKAKRKLDDKRFTSLERKIVQGHLLLRDNKNKDVVELLANQPSSELFFVESQRLLLLSCAYNNLGQLVKAEINILKSIEIVQNLDTPYFIFLGWFNYFWICSNLNKLQGMEVCIQKMLELSLDSKKEQARVFRCQFCFYQMSNRLKEAEVSMKLLEKIKNSLSESEIVFYLTDKFMFYVQTEKFDKAAQVLEEMKKNRKFSLSENFQFMRTLLKHIMSDTVIYAYDEDFKNTSILLWQIKVIQSLESREQDIAASYWNKLASEYPDVYKPDFVYNGTKCLFSICLEKHKSKEPLNSYDFQDGLTKIEKLKIIFSKEKNPISATNIFEIIWDRSCDTKDDLLKLSKLIYRLKVECPEIQIEYKKGTYKAIVATQVAS